jgi:type VI secretion system FHA domain protein
MALKLRVISHHHKSLGPRRSQLFGVTGGTIGRAPGNDWVLPDTKHFVSSRHATVSFRAGSWLLEDTSRNGVYLNDADTPLAEIGPAKLEDGDRLRIGEYDVLVSVDEQSDFSPDASGQMPTPSALREASAARSKRSRSAASKPVAFRPVEFRSEPAPTEVKLDAYLQPDLDVTDVLVRTRQNEDKKDISANSASIQLNVDGFAGVSDALADFCRGLAIDPSTLPSRPQSVLLNTAGQLLRETVQQLTRTLRSQAVRASELELDANTARDVGDNPLQTSPNFQATVQRLLSTPSDRQLNGTDALQDAFEQVRGHHEAFDAAVTTAVDELLSRVHPSRLAARVDHSGAASSPFSGSKKAKYWDLFTEVHAAIEQRDDHGWPTAFTREFSKAMAAKLRDRQKRES